MKSILSLTKLLIQLNVSLECKMAEVPQEIKDQIIAVMKKHLPDVDDTTINLILEETVAIVNERIAKAVILPR